MDQSYINELKGTKNRLTIIPQELKAMRDHLIAFSDERNKKIIKYEDYYSKLLQEVNRAYEQKYKTCIITRYAIGGVSRLHADVVIDDLEKIAMGVLIRNLTELGYVTSLESKCERNPLYDGPEYEAWLELTITFY